MTHRREFLQSLGRWSALAGLGALGVFLAVPTEGRRSECLREFKCRGCSRLADCSEPEAGRQREAEIARPGGVDG